MEVFDICLELPSDSEKHFGFVVGEFSELVHTRNKFRCLRLGLFVAIPASQKPGEVVTVVLFRAKIRGLVSFRELKSEITTVSVMAVPFRELSQKT